MPGLINLKQCSDVHICISYASEMRRYGPDDRQPPCLSWRPHLCSCCRSGMQWVVKRAVSQVATAGRFILPINARTACGLLIAPLQQLLSYASMVQIENNNLRTPLNFAMTHGFSASRWLRLRRPLAIRIGALSMIRYLLHSHSKIAASWQICPKSNCYSLIRNVGASALLMTNLPFNTALAQSNECQRKPHLDIWHLLQAYWQSESLTAFTSKADLLEDLQCEGIVY